MCLKHKQLGVSLVTAIFILVVLAALGAAMARFSSVQHITSALDVQGSRAYQAARAGVEWAAYQAINNSTNFPCATAGSSANTLTIPSMPGFTVDVTCTSYSTTEGGKGITSYGINSKGYAGGAPGDPDYVERDITVNISN
jgi:MSHA biogenesis protein MshP